MKTNLHWLLRSISILLAILQGTVTVVPVSVWAASLPKTSTSGGSLMAERQVNRRAAKNEPIQIMPAFSAQPTAAEFFSVHVFPYALVPVGMQTPEDNKKLAQALDEYVVRTNWADQSVLLKFIDQNPASAWKPALLLNLGIFWRQAGYFSKAMNAWEQAWESSKNAGQPRERALADRAVGELTQINSWVGRYEALEPILAEIGDRKLIGGASEMLADAKDGLWIMNHHPGQGFLCGPCALQILAGDQKNLDLSVLKNAKSSRQGFSLAQLKSLADQTGLKYQLAKRSPGSVMQTNVVIHWKLNHYGAVVAEKDGLYLIKDATFSQMYGQQLWVTKAVIDEESDGYFLIPAGPLPAGWAKVSLKEAEKVWGKGATGARNSSALTPKDPCLPCDILNWLESIFGMARYSAHLMLVSLKLEDMPLRYDPPVGPPIDFHVTYIQRDPNSQAFPNYSNLGAQWTCDWFSSISDEAHAFFGSGVNITRYVGGGGTIAYPSVGSIDRDGNILQFTNNTYELIAPDGSKMVYGDPNRPIPFIVSRQLLPRKFLLHSIVDPAGNTLFFSYDGSGRLYQVNDAVGQATTLYYDLSTDPYKVTRVEDPFGRTAHFDYDANGRLRKITDVIGLASSFAYDSADFVQQLATPYGITKFSMIDGGDSDVRALYITDPNGDHEYIYSPATSDSVSGIGTGESAPSGFGSGNLGYRNTFYFDKKAMSSIISQLLNDPAAPALKSDALTSGVMTNATIYHWLHDNDAGALGPVLTSGILESIKPPLESRIWYGYPGEASAEQSYGITLRKPSVVARLVDNPVNPSSPLTQAYQYEYDSYGRLTQYTDPVGRETLFDYYSNGTDLYRVRQADGAGSDILEEFGTYNLQHRPSSYLDAARMTYSLSWNSAGQLSQVTNPRSEITKLNYDADNYLRSVVRSKSGLAATNSFGYDSYGRCDAFTNAENYYITCGYDNLDRPTEVSYPDGTSQKYIYKRLDLFLASDRAGSRTVYHYDNTGRLISVKDRLNRVTQFSWCGCGGLASMTDPLGHVTMWDHDLAGRITQKTYNNSSSVLYSYEAYSGRLSAITDPKSQTKSYAYNVDDTISNIIYSASVIATPNVTFNYDPNYPRLTSMTDGTGTSTYTYYPITGSTALGAGQLESEYQPLANATINYQYDELGRCTNRAIDGTSEKWAFDALGRATSHVTSLGTFTPSYVNDTYQISSLAYPNGQTMAFSWFDNSEDQNLQEIWNKISGTTISRFDYQYDANRRIKQWAQTLSTASNVWNLAYDYEDELTDVRILSNSIPVKAYAYGYDGMGNRTNSQYEVKSTNVVASYSQYNDLNQLTNHVGTPGPLPVHFRGTVDEPASVTINSQTADVIPDPDSASNGKIFTSTINLPLGGNSMQIVATDYGGTPKSATQNYYVIVSGDTNKAYSYDLNGNQIDVVTALSTNAYEYDAENRLMKITRLTNNLQWVSEFAYDGLDRRVQAFEQSNGVPIVTNHFVWAGSQICQERDDQNSVTKQFYPEGEMVTTNAYFYAFDHLGSVREVTDYSGAVLARYDYDAYGNQKKLSGSVDADFGFAGYYHHMPSGLYLTLYRAYDSDTGRWLNRDPIQEAGGMNLYRYVENDPVNKIDPNGKFALLLTALAAAIVITAISEAVKDYEAYKGKYAQAEHEAQQGKNFNANDWIYGRAGDNSHGSPDSMGPSHWGTCAEAGAAAIKLGADIPGTSLNPPFDKANTPPLAPEYEEGVETASKLTDAGKELSGKALDELDDTETNEHNNPPEK